MSAEVASALAFAVAAGVVLVLRPHLSRLPALVQSGRSRVVSGPPLAGVAIFLAVVVSALAFLPLEGVYRGILIGLGVIAVVGFLADSRGLSPLAMFAGQLAAAIVPVLYGVSIDRFTFPLVGVVADVPDWLGQPLAVAWILVFVRLVDFVDGVDGLAAAVCALASVVFVVLSLRLDDRSSAILCAIIAGVSAAFLARNFYPARLLLGHVGALVLGYLVGVVTLAGLLKTAAVVGVFFPLAVLAVPALDASLVFRRRLAPILGADAQDVERGLPGSSRRVQEVLVLWVAIVGACAVASGVIAFRAHGTWHAGRTSVVVALAVVALVSSAYVIVLLEATRRTRRAAGQGGWERDERRFLVPPEDVGVATQPDELAPGGEAIAMARSAGLTTHRSTDVTLRALDLAVSATALALLLPVIAVILGLVLVTSGRPLFYAGERVGWHGRMFTMRKVRTLVADADTRIGRYYGAALDQRLGTEVTRLGRVLRATHLDEIPQLWNVLKGDMSVVGPRPLRPRFFEELCEEIPQYWQRLTVRPGLTGLAQIRVDRGIGWDEKLAHDLEWIADRSMRLYLLTAAQTVWRIVVAVGRAAWPGG